MRINILAQRDFGPSLFHVALVQKDDKGNIACRIIVRNMNLIPKHRDEGS